MPRRRAAPRWRVYTVASAIAAAALVAAAPPAAACSWVEPSPFESLVWPTHSTLIVNQGFGAGTFKTASGSFAAVGSIAFDNAFAASANGAWVVLASGTYRESRDGSSTDSCDTGSGRVTALGADGERVLVSARGATGLLATPDHLVVAEGRGLAFVTWSTFEEVARVVAFPRGDANGPFVRTLAADATGERVAAATTTTIKVVDVATRRVLAQAQAPDGFYVADIALAPDGTRFAYAAGPAHAGAFVAVVDIATARETNRVTFTERDIEVGSLAWGSEGLALTTSRGSDAPDGGKVWTSGVRVYDAALTQLAGRATGTAWREDVAWSPDGGTLAVGGGGNLTLFTADLVAERGQFSLAHGTPDFDETRVDRRAPFADATPLARAWYDVPGPAVLGVLGAGVVAAAWRRRPA